MTDEQKARADIMVAVINNPHNAYRVSWEVEAEAERLYN